MALVQTTMLASRNSPVGAEAVLDFYVRSDILFFIAPNAAEWDQKDVTATGCCCMDESASDR
jgi:hypothetical protein